MISRKINRNFLLSWVIIAAVIVFALTGAVFGMSKNPNNTVTYAAPIYADGSNSNIDYVVDEQYNLYYDKKINFGNGATTADSGYYKSGDVLSESPIYLSSAAVENEGNITRIDEKPNGTWTINLKIDSNSDLAAALRDRLVAVTFEAYYIGYTPSLPDGLSESCKVRLSYYNGTTTTVEQEGESNREEANRQSVEATVGFIANSVAGGFKQMATLEPTNVMGENDIYVSLELSDFITNGSFSVALKEMGIRVKTAPLSNMGITVQPTVYDVTGYRLPDAMDNHIKSSDIVYLKNIVTIGNDTIELDKSTDYNSPTSAHGRFYRKLFLRGSADPILKCDFNGAHFEMLTSAAVTDADGDGIDLDTSKDISGEQVILKVKSATVAEIKIRIRMWRGDGTEISFNKESVFYLDNTAALQPVLDSSNDFVNKYLSTQNKQYFTNQDSYIYSEIDFGGEKKSIITGVDLGRVANNPEFTANSLAINGSDAGSGFTGTSQSIYYRVKRLEKEPSGGNYATEFKLSEATGRYCRILAPAVYGGTPTVIYESLNLSLVTDDNGDPVYNKNGIYSIEFMTVDDVGNRATSQAQYFIRVDVEDYKFNYKLNLGIGADSELTENEVRVSFSTMNDNNEFSSYTESPIFKRGDKVRVRVRFVGSTNFNNYVLTNFRIYTHEMSIKNYTGGTDFSVVLEQSTDLPYTFQVTSAYTNDSSFRSFSLTFKQRVKISVSKTKATYTGDGLGVFAQIDTGSTIINANVKTTYSVAGENKFSTNLPVDRGLYDYRCELEDHKYYYGFNSGTFEILPAEPTINSLMIFPIDYGQSLSIIDFDENANPQVINNSIMSVGSDGKYYSDRSYNGIYGYFKLSSPSSNSNNYISPSAGILSVTVEFVPIKWQLNSKGEVEFIMENGKFVRDNNYRTVSVSSTVEIRHSEDVELKVDGEKDRVIVYDYDGAKKAVTASISSGMDGSNLIEYTLIRYRGEGETEFSLTAPSDAGVYEVEIEIQSALCNYTGSWIYTLVINQKLLNVTCDDTIYDYQYEASPKPTASFGFGLDAEMYPNLKYSFEYFYYNGGAYADSVTPENKVPVEDYFAGTQMPDKAGAYVVKILLDETNYTNYASYAKVTIKRAGVSSVNINLSVPTVGYNTVNREAHLSYLQPLSNIVLDSNVNTGVKYSFHEMTIDNRVNRVIRSVDGYFILAYREFLGYEVETVEDFVSAMKSYDGYSVGRQTAYIYFIPTDEYSNNFEPLGRETEIMVGRAQIIMDDVVITPIVYGNSIESIEDIEISYNAKILISGSGVNAVYRVLNYTDEVEGYAFSLELGAARVYEAGTHYLDVIVTPKDAGLFVPLTYSCLLTVDKKELNITFAETGMTDGRYIYTYGGVGTPAVIYEGAQGVAVTGTTTYYDEKGIVKGRLNTGNYRAVYEVTDDNYCGKNEYLLTVNKDTVRVSRIPSIYEEKTTVSYNRLMSAVAFYDGRMLAVNTGEQVEGVFSLNYADGTRFTDTGTRKSYELKFVPNDGNNYEIYTANDFTISLTVSKADISSEMGISIADNLVYGDLRYDFNAADYVTYTTPIYFKVNADGTMSYSDVKTEGFSVLNASIEVSNRPASGLVNAGSYAIRVSLDDLNYSGVITGNLVVAKKRAVIEITNNEKVFSNRNQNVDYVIRANGDLIQQTVTQVFYLNGIRQVGAPSNIGKYQVYLDLLSNNYAAEQVVTDFTIKVDPNQITVTNTEQVYNMPRNVAVTLGLNDANFTLSYWHEATRMEYATLPVNSGEYLIRLSFDANSNNGYEEVIVYSKPLIIRKANVQITVNERITINYTGNSYTIRAATSPYGLNLKVEYLAEGSLEYTEEEVLSANTGDNYHLVRFTVQDDNYSGEKTVYYRINPAQLSLITAPTFADFTYNGKEIPDISVPGRVDFGTTTDIRGRYSLNIDEISILPVGTHRVSYSFTAEDENGDIDSNFYVATGQTTLNILKRKILDEDIRIGEVSGSYANYNGNSFSVDAVVSEDLIYDIRQSNADFQIRVYYNGVEDPPREPGEYTVRAVISSRNYEGEHTWATTFNVDLGTPKISVLPVLGQGIAFKIGDSIQTSHITGGEAVILGTNTKVSGSFAIITKTFSKANINDAEFLFTPTDTGHFKPVRGTISVFVEGENILEGVKSGESWQGKEIKVKEYGFVTVKASADRKIEFGSPLSVFNLEFTGDIAAVAYLNSFGILSFKNPNAVLKVGENAEIVFTPVGSNADAYSIMYGYLNVDIEKAEWNQNTEFALKSYADKPLNAAEFIITVNGSILNPNGILTLFTDESYIDSLDMDTPPDRLLNNTTVYFRYISNDYVDLEGQVVLKIVNNISSDDIIVRNYQKSYDGKGIQLSDLGVEVINVSNPVSQSDISLRVYRNGVESDGTEVGEYLIVIYVDNQLYYGTKSITFIRTKRDISDVMELSEYSSVYASVYAPSVIVDGDYLNASLYTVQYKRKESSDASYNGNLPVNAGLYEIRVSIDSENYSGIKVFEYTVEKLTVRLNAQNVYRYNYGEAQTPPISFLYTDSENTVALEFKLYFYSDSYSMTEVLPDNAGTYRARVVLNDENYTLSSVGYAEFEYIIDKMIVTITETPAPESFTEDGRTYNLKYGQSLDELILLGGTASRNDIAVDGYFSVSDKSAVLGAGTHIIEITFTPYNSNYESAAAEISLVVAQADANVIFDKLQASYNGLSLKDSLQYTVSPYGVKVNISFRNSVGNVISEPTAAGSYTIFVESADPNYRVFSITSISGNENPVFVIAKASVRDSVPPRANAVTVGDSLNKSSLTSGEGYGQVYYNGFISPISGSYSFLESSLVFMSAGTYTVNYIFTPTDTENFAVHTGETSILINRANATIAVSGNKYVYSEGFTYPLFTTSPSGLAVKHNITFREYDPKSPNYIFNEEDIVNVGTYYFEAWVEDENYSSQRIEFAIEIEKKTLDMDFVDGNGNPVLQYTTTYGKSLSAKIKLYPSGTLGKRGYLLKDEVVNGVNISDTYEIRYLSLEAGLVYDSQISPVNIGTYTVSVTLINRNYTATKTVLYKVDRGVIENIHLDTATLEQQIYGNVVDPIVTTRPSNVSYYIVYQGYGTIRPNDAGSYNITVYFNDNNYEKRQVSAMFKINKKALEITNIIVSDKVYDGVATLSVQGQLSGLLYGDEVNLSMSAETVNQDFNIGWHYVNITKYTLTGLQALNYDLKTPVYNGQIQIKTNTVKNESPNNASFVSSSNGFESGTTIMFNYVDSKVGKAGFFEKLTGRNSVMIGYTIKENGYDIILNDRVKVYVAIPEQFLNSDSFEISFAGALAEQNISPVREGNFYTFYASSATGQVIFKETKFRYEFVVIIAAIIIFIIGVIILLILNPLQSRSKISDNSAEKRVRNRIRRGY